MQYHTKLNSVFLFSASCGQISHLKFFIEMGVDINYRSEKGWTSLQAAAMFDRGAVVKFLLDQGADISPQNQDGWTALMFAVSNESLELVEPLMTKKLINLQNNEGLSALMMAAKLGNSELVKLLLENGADPSVKDSRGFDAYTRASLGNFKDLALQIDTFSYGSKR